MKQLKKFLTSKEVLVTLFLLIIYGCLIFTIYFNGYSGVPKKVEDMPVTIVNQDSNSKHLANQLNDSLPFNHIHHSNNLNSTKQKLNDRKTFLIIAIPKNFSKDINQNKSVNLNFYINQSNQSAVTSGMNTVASSVGSTINQQVILKKGQAMLAEGQMSVLKKTLATQQKKMAAQVNTQNKPLQLHQLLPNLNLKPDLSNRLPQVVKNLIKLPKCRKLKSSKE
ncbi:YhgE/Pip domain-containing protein [Lentilactobacillus kosonis]|uniref:Conserved domain protein n=1 Tax=Lentilactobacillus kosonis TaxID=2810561 RepID=A0A401FIK3_9LACO|nr:ABC transporter permease [Lentilactobacillus kosonis]GAY72192.1 conserved domain protein [Lentilactobacillus kosonis]